MEVVTAGYEGRLLTTDVECEVLSSLSVVLGSNWLFAWREVWRSQLGSSSIPKCIAASPATGQRQAQPEDLGGRDKVVPQCNEFNT